MFGIGLPELIVLVMVIALIAAVVASVSKKRQ
jgi:hypothetical protein